MGNFYDEVAVLRRLQFPKLLVGLSRGGSSQVDAAALLAFRMGCLFTELRLKEDGQVPYLLTLRLGKLWQS